MRRFLTVLLVIILLIFGISAASESKMMIGKSIAQVSKENAKLLADLYSFDPDGFSAKMMDLFFNYSLMYMVSVETNTAEILFATNSENEVDIRDKNYTNMKAFALTTEKLMGMYEQWLNKEITNKELGDVLVGMLDNISIGSSENQSKKTSSGMVVNKDEREIMSVNAFLEDLSLGLQERFYQPEVDVSKFTDSQKIDYYCYCISCELDYIEKYESAYFDNLEFENMVHEIIASLRRLYEAIKNYYGKDNTLLSEEEGIAVDIHFQVVYKILREYGLNIPEDLKEYLLAEGCFDQSGLTAN